MTRNRRIYLLNPQKLSPEAIAVAFAKTSRSPKAFDEIAAELSDERTTRFHEKWVVGYGHASVAEHAVLHVAIENVSRLAIETIENNRLASYTEKSTRYQQWQQDAFFVPDEIQESRYKEDYVHTCQALFRTYQDLMPDIKGWLMTQLDQQDGESDAAFQRRIQSEASDVCRFLLPAASLANVGVTINARALEYAICKMLSSPLAEVRSIGEHLREVGQQEAPTLIKYADCNAYLVGVREKIQGMQISRTDQDQDQDFKLIDWDREGEIKILAGMLCRFGAAAGFQKAMRIVRNLSADEQKMLAEEIMAGRNRYDQPLREFEYAVMTFEAVMDQGAYYEFKRHRMMTQTVEPLGTFLGFGVPQAVVGAGCLDRYKNAMRKTADLYQSLVKWNPDAASYIVPNGFNRRVLFNLNLREAFHFCRLRAAHNAHFSIRRLGLRVAEKIREIYPLFGPYLDVPPRETSQQVEDRYFAQLQAE